MRTRVFRYSGFILAAGLVTVSAVEYISWHHQQSEIASVLQTAVIADRYPEIIADVSREPDADAARLRAARVLLAVEANLEDRTATAEAERQSLGVENLRRAQDLAQKVLLTRPSSWQAHLIIGASTFLELSRSRDPRMIADRGMWEDPLLIAHELAPAQSEPPRFLAAAYLSEWSRLDDESREQALPVLATALNDPGTLDLLLAQWLRVAPSLETALSVMPSRSQAWRKVMRFHAVRSDWERYCSAREQLEDLLLEELGEEIRSARARLSSGDASTARRQLLSILERAPTRGPFERVLIDLLATLPPGPVSARRAQMLSTWFDWARERCLQGRCELPPETLSRLAGLAEISDPARLAEAAVLAGDLPRAELWERRAPTLTPEWAPYLLLKALHLSERGLAREAEAALDNVVGEWRRRPEYRLVARRLGVASPAAGISISEWDSLRGKHRLTISAAEQAGILEIGVGATRAQGGAVDAFWNGTRVGCYPVYTESRLRLEPPYPTELDRLELQPLEELRIRPAEVRFTSASGERTRPRRRQP